MVVGEEVESLIFLLYSAWIVGGLVVVEGWLETHISHTWLWERALGMGQIG